MTKPVLTASTAFVRFARHLRETHPLVPISAALNNQITGFIDRVRLAQALDDDDVGWEGMVCSMGEAAISLASREHGLPRCGLPLLRAYGHLSEVVLHTQSVYLPPPIAIVLLMEYQPLPLLFDWTEEGVATTPNGVAQLGGRASLTVPHAPKSAFGWDFFRWHLDRLEGRD